MQIPSKGVRGGLQSLPNPVKPLGLAGGTKCQNGIPNPSRGPKKHHETTLNLHPNPHTYAGFLLKTSIADFCTQRPKSPRTVSKGGRSGRKPPQKRRFSLQWEEEPKLKIPSSLYTSPDPTLWSPKMRRSSSSQRQARITFVQPRHPLDNVCTPQHPYFDRPGHVDPYAMILSQGPLPCLP